MKKTILERLSWMAGIVSALAALFFGWQQMFASNVAEHNITNNQAPVVLT